MHLFRQELEELINKFSLENGSNTPDFILADYLINCLEVFDKTVIRREVWYGRTSNFVEKVEVMETQAGTAQSNT